MLTERDIEEAVEYGLRNKQLSHSALLRDWRIDYGYGIGSATLVTPYASLIILAKESALMFREPTGHEIVHMLKDMENSLLFRCSLYGEDIDFAPKCKVMLEHHGMTRKPTTTILPAAADYTPNYPAPPKFRAVSTFYFSLEGIDPMGRVNLIITDPKGKEMKFFFDLSALR